MTKNSQWEKPNKIYLYKKKKKLNYLNTLKHKT